ncbi:MAG TPA: SAM-dependent chlorinase/fluorinase [Candidatus Limnocylindrales bacterium]
MAGPLVSLLTDFGSRDPSAAICRGVIWSIAPDARLLDISHEVAKYAIRDGALLLWCAIPYLPVGTHMAVVDPGVGSDRRPIAIRVGRGDVLIGPDNGLLLPATERLGAITAVVELTNQAYRLPVVSPSFHGRDIFSPAAAHLALGVPLDAMGPSVDPASLVSLAIPDPVVEPGRLRSAIVYRDTFGNAKFAGLRRDLEAALGPLVPGDRLVLQVAGHGTTPAATIQLAWQQTFAGAGEGEPLAYEDSYGRVCLAVDRGNAVDRYGLVDDLEVTISRDHSTGS